MQIINPQPNRLRLLIAAVFAISSWACTIRGIPASLDHTVVINQQNGRDTRPHPLAYPCDRDPAIALRLAFGLFCSGMLFGFFGNMALKGTISKKYTRKELTTNQIRDKFQFWARACQGIAVMGMVAAGEQIVLLLL